MSEVLIDILWESRNLGMKSFSVADAFMKSPDKTVLEMEVAEKVGRFGRIFIQSRVAKSEIRAAHILEKAGFYFVESTLIPFTVFEKNTALQRFIKDRGDFVPERYSPDDLRLINDVDKRDDAIRDTVKEIARESFSDDRFHIDPNCGKEVADRRMAFWVDDLFNDSESVIRLLEYQGRPVAFGARNATSLILGGFSRRFTKSGLGDYLMLSRLEEMAKKGLDHAHTLISANNIPMLNLCSRLGFKFKDPSATFHFWS